MTRFEIIAKALPLHAQTIAERTFQHNWDAEGMLTYLMIKESPSRETASDILGGLFVWSETEEGQDYWEALQQRGSLGHPAS